MWNSIRPKIEINFQRTNNNMRTNEGPRPLSHIDNFSTDDRTRHIDVGYFAT